MRRSCCFVFASGMSLGLAGLVAAMPASFAEIAPRNTAILIDVPNFGVVRASVERSGLMDLWNDRSLRGWFDNFSKEAIEDLQENLNALNLKLDDLKAPTGLAGAALWIESPAGRPSEGTMHMLVAADFGENAAAMVETIANLIQRGEREGELKVAYDKFGDIEVTVITLPEPDEEWGDHSMAPKKLHYAKRGNFLTLSSSMDALEDAIDALGGKNIDSASDGPDLAATLSQHPRGVQAYAALLNAPLFSQLNKLAEAEELDIPAELFASLGLTDVRAASIGLNFEPRAGLMEQTLGVLMNEKKGVFSLMDVPPARFQPPSFASSDSASVSMYQFNLSGLLPLVRRITAGSQDPRMQMAAQQLPMVEQMVGPILNSLGSRIYQVDSFARPFSAKSSRTVVAIELRDRDAFSGAISGFAPMIGLQARDFQGNQIWAMPEGGMMMLPIDIAISAAGGFAYFGSTQAIEDALRQADRGAGLAQEDRFKGAMASISNEGLSFGWTDMRQVLRYMEWTWKNQEAIIRDQVNAIFGDDPEFEDWRQEMIEDQLSNIPAWMKNPPNIEGVLRHLGDTVFEINSTPDGLRGRVLWLKPGN